MYEPGYHLFLLIVIPVVLLACWFAFNRERSSLAVLIVSILLVLLDIPHLFIFPTLVKGGSFAGLTTFAFLLPLLLLGIGCIVFGVRGIIYSRKALAQKAAW
jgi:hypothetical protein